MKRILLIAVLFAFSQLTFAQGTTEKKKDYSKEAKPEFVIKIDGKEYSVAEGDEIDVETKKGKSTISVELAKQKKFDNGTYSFKYGNHFAFEYEGDVGYQNWTLDGNNCTLMMFEMQGMVTLEMFVLQMVSQFGKDNCQTSSIKKKFGSKTLKGTRIKVSLVGQRMNVDLYDIEMDGDKKHFLVIQDMLDDDENPTEEAISTMALMDKTIRY